jgi:predicted unusual protein kinase regulating ubiquinone biosynthesis (AarF/ABC1/UbiB family)
MADLPRKAVTRTARLASLPLSYAGRQAVGMGKRLGGAPAEAVLSEMQQRTAEQVFRTLGELKGGAMKFGQALSVLESVLPDEVAAPYRQHLMRLQDAAPPMESTTVHRVLAEQLGPAWRTQFTEFDDEPAAAASLGQVHRARWHDGQEVAVKVQYPGAAEAISSDLRQIARLARTMGALLPGLDVKPLIAELQARVHEELDYELEAQAQQGFAEAFADDERFVIPHVVKATPQVLVTEWLESPGSLASIIESGTPRERHHYGSLYARFLFEGPARAGMLHADPHPGNFRIVPGPKKALGKLGILDFGAVARLPDGQFPRAIGLLMRAAVDEDYAKVLEGLRAEGFVRPNIKVEPDDLRSYIEPFLEPFAADSFSFSRTYMREQAQRLPSEKLALRLNLPPEYLLIQRTWVGGVGVLCQLETKAEIRAILEELLPGFAPV